MTNDNDKVGQIILEVLLFFNGGKLISVAGGTLHDDITQAPSVAHKLLMWSVPIDRFINLLDQYFKHIIL